MNSATASGLLGGTVQENSCLFTMQSSHGFKSLRIEVQPLSASGIGAYLGRCKGEKTPLRGLGDEAFACRIEAKRKTKAVRVAGRVRNQIFVVDIRTNQRHARSEALIAVAKEAADGVAGDLF